MSLTRLIDLAAIYKVGTEWSEAYEKDKPASLCGIQLKKAGKLYVIQWNKTVTAFGSTPESAANRLYKTLAAELAEHQSENQLEQKLEQSLKLLKVVKHVE